MATRSIAPGAITPGAGRDGAARARRMICAEGVKRGTGSRQRARSLGMSSPVMRSTACATFAARAGLAT